MWKYLFSRNQPQWCHDGYCLNLGSWKRLDISHSAWSALSDAIFSGGMNGAVHGTVLLNDYWFPSYAARESYWIVMGMTMTRRWAAGIEQKTRYVTVTSWWARWRLKSPAPRMFAQPFVQAQIKENMKAPRHWPLWGESTGNRWIPLTKDQWRGKCFHLITSSSKRYISALSSVIIANPCAVYFTERKI